MWRIAWHKVAANGSEAGQIGLARRGESQAERPETGHKLVRGQLGVVQGGKMTRTGPGPGRKTSQGKRGKVGKPPNRASQGQGQGQGGGSRARARTSNKTAPGPFSPADGGEGPGVSRGRPRGPPTQNPTLCADSLGFREDKNTVTTADSACACLEGKPAWRPARSPAWGSLATSARLP